MNVLITSASRKVSLVQAFQAGLAATGGGKVIAADLNPLCAALALADEAVLVPRSDSPEFLPTLLQICHQYEIGLIVPTRDQELAYFAEQQQRIQQQTGACVAISSPVAIETCQDKRAFLAFCRTEGIPTPATYDSPSSLTTAELPVFVKPRNGQGGQDARCIRELEQLRTAIARQPDLIVQEMCDWLEYTIDVFSDFEGRVLSAVPRERQVVFGGESFVGVTRQITPLIEASQQLAERLELQGHTTIQAFYEKGKTKFIEVNPRFGGGASLGFAAGAPSPQWLIQLAKGQHLNPMIGCFAADRYMLRYTQDVFVDEAEVKRRLAS